MDVFKLKSTPKGNVIYNIDKNGLKIYMFVSDHNEAMRYLALLNKL